MGVPNGGPKWGSQMGVPYHPPNWGLKSKYQIGVPNRGPYVCLFVVTRPAGTRDRFIAEISPTPTLYNVQNVHVYNSSRHDRTLLQVWARIHIIATRHPASQAQGKRSPHDLPDLLSGRGLTYEGLRGP
jgi:hypothetical protein